MHIELEQIDARIARAIGRADREPNDCTLIAVSKTKPVSAVDEARSLGLSHFGENKVQEAIQKFPPFENRPSGETLHLIGPLQSNKARQAVQHFDYIHTLDRPKLVSILARLADEVGRCPKLLIQVNTGEEPQKAGILPSDLPGLVHQARDAGLPLVGLMCIPPAEQAPAPHFAWLARAAQDLKLRELSMGMSQDFEAAIELGATFVRVGSALFGERTKHG